MQLCYTEQYVHRTDSCRFSINRKGRTGGGGLTHRVLCTWRLLGLAVKWPWILKSSLLAENADYCKFNRGWLGSQVCLLWLQNYLDSVMESGLYQKRKDGYIEGMYVDVKMISNELKNLAVKS